jgi:hypothetical protein
MAIEFATEFFSSATRNFAGRMAFTSSMSFRGNFELRGLALSGGFKALRVLFDFYNASNQTSTGLQQVLRL